MSRRFVLIATVLAGLLAGGLVGWQLDGPASGFARALAFAPAGTDRVSWTDWAGVRRELGVDLGPGSSPQEVEDFLDEAFTRDLSASSALVSSAVTLHEEFGFSPATLDWELLAQSPDGAMGALGLSGDGVFDDVRERLTAFGWTPPDQPDGVWVGGTDVLVRVGPGLTPQLQHVAVLEDEGVLLTSDQSAYLQRAVDVATGDGSAVDGLADVVEDLEDPLSGVAYTGAHTCEKLAMAQADGAAQDEADDLIEAAGGLHPLTAFAMGQRADGIVRVALEVEDPDDAPADADARAALAAGPAPGQGGDFGDRFSVVEASSRERVITLDLRPLEGQYVVSDLSSGPVLFASC